MFFNLAQQHKPNFVAHWPLGSLVLNTDAGWSQVDIDHYTCVYKGYAEDYRLADGIPHLIHQTVPRDLGNFCVVVLDNVSGEIFFRTDLYRSFPIWQHESGEITNLVAGKQTFWTDSLITVDQSLAVREQKFDIIGTIDDSELSVKQVVSMINSRLLDRAQQFVDNNPSRINVFLSGGVDTMLVFGLLQSVTCNYRIISGSGIEFDEFWLKNSGTITKNFWGYCQIHHWRAPSILASGAPGDEFMLRSPTTLDLYLKYHGIDTATELEKPEWRDCLHYKYFHRPGNQAIFHRQGVNRAQSRSELVRSLCNIIVNDWQHWHLGNTLTWTPLRDLEIFKLILRLPLDAAMDQIFNSTISCQLIEKNSPGATKWISTHKNSDNPLENLCDFLLPKMPRI